MSSPKPWFRGATLAALVLSLATPGCLAETDDVEVETPYLEDQGIDPGSSYDMVDEPALELMAEGRFGDTVAWQDPTFAPSDAPAMNAERLSNDGEEEGEPTPQPWHSEVNDDPGDEGGPDPVPWHVADLGPDPVPWHTDDDLEKSTGGQAKGRQRYDPN